MPVAQPNTEICVLCHEHHMQMKLHQIFVGTNGVRTRVLAYACPETDCFVHYSSSHGYFMFSQDESRIETESLMPRVRCEMDGMPMYLAEVLPERMAFRLWTCPKCSMNRAVNVKIEVQKRECV
jgi:hypothetical protein